MAKEEGREARRKSVEWGMGEGVVEVGEKLMGEEKGDEEEEEKGVMRGRWEKGVMRGRGEGCYERKVGEGCYERKRRVL